MNVTVLGGAGRLGRWITEFLLKENFKVKISTPNPDKHADFIKRKNIPYYKENSESVKDADVVVLSVPLEKTITVLSEIFPYLKDGAIVVDISSVKKPFFEFVQKKSDIISNKKLRILSLHPMFGPGAKSLKKQNVVVVKSGLNNELADLAVRFLKEHGANVVIASPEEHDKMIALTLSLPHFSLMLFTAMLKESPDREAIKKFSGSTFKTLYLAAESLLKESVELYAHIQIENPYFKELLRKYQQQFNELLNIVLNSDIDGFKRFWSENILSLEALKEADEAYAKLYEILEKIW